MAKQKAPQKSAPPGALDAFYEGVDHLHHEGSFQHFRQLLENIHTVNAYSAAVRSLIGKKFGISRPQVDILYYLCEEDIEKGQSVQKIADHLMVSGTFVTNETKKLERAGILERKADPNDKRRVRLIFAKRGMVLVKALGKLLGEAAEARWKNISHEQFMMMADAYEELVRSSERYHHLMKARLMEIELADLGL